MEDDDEFGDLYTDVLRPLSSSLSSDSPATAALAPPPPPIYLSNVVNDDDEILYGKSRRDPPSLVNQTLADSSSQKNATIAPVNVSGGGARVLGSIDVKLGKKETGGSDLVGFQPGEVDKDVKFDIDEGNDEGIGDNNGSIIPGLGVDFNDSARNDDVRGDGGGGGDEDWEEDSDSEDDLQILLNETNNHGMERGGMGGEEYDEDEDGDPNQGMEEQNWGGGEDSSAAGGAGGLEGERKEGDAVGKGSGVVGPKIGYSNHVYHHPFHSQFKYVRPGAAPISGGNAVGPGGTPSQVRPPLTVGPMVGRGRGDWRPVGIKNAPPMQKGFHPPAWGSGRGFGGGLEFTLPSHKTIFEVDIDSFEEKPWKYPGVELSDFFNFDLNEESWKAYCKQLEQLRLETTMQSKIRVYESGRAENEFDPDLPPELAAAAGGHEVQPDNSNIGKPHGAQNDLTRGSAPMRPPLPPGKPIQVETGYGERLPSIDTRPPRMRDNDVIIEIPLLDSQDDSSTGNDIPDADGDVDPSQSHVAEDETTAMETEHGNDFPQAHNSQKVVVPPLTKSVSDDIPEGGRMQSFHHEASAQYSPGSRMQHQRSPGVDTGSDYERRRTRHKKSPHWTPTRTARDKRFHDSGEEESIESMDGKHSSPSSPVMVKNGKEWSNEGNDSPAANDDVLAEGSLQTEKDEHELATSVSHKEENMHHTTKKQKVMSHSEHAKTHDLDDGEDSKAARSSENSKARSGSSKDYQKRRDGTEDEVVQDRRSRRGGSLKRNLDENEQNFQTRDRDGRHMERSYLAMKGREDSYPHMDIDSTRGHHPHSRNEIFDRRKDQDPDGALERRDGDPLGRKNRNEDTRKRERGDEMGYRHRSKNRDSERSDKDELVPSRKHLESGSYKGHYDKDGSSRHRERDEKRSKYGINDEYQSKRRKDEEYMRRDVIEKEEVMHGHRETTNRRRRERDEMIDPRKRDDQLRVRDNLDDYYQARQKDQVWPQRERGERQREREEFYRLKQPYEEIPSTREREDGRGSIRTARAIDDKSLFGHARMKDEYRGSDKEYPVKDSVRTGEQQRRRDRMEDEVFSHHRGHEDPYARGYQFQSEDRRSRQERSSTRFDKSADASDTQKLQEKKYKETTRKNRESEGGEHNISAHSRRSEDQSGRVDDTGFKGKTEVRNGGVEMPTQRNSTVKHKEDASSDDEQQDSRRGRSKLERWTSHKEREYNSSSKSSRYKDIDKNTDQGAVESSKLPDEPAKVTEVAEKHSLGKETAPVENKRSDKKPLDEKHLDTVEKLKKRSERFKLPLPIEKDASTIKKTEPEVLPTVNPETNKDSEVKSERPARKRRWTGS